MDMGRLSISSNYKTEKFNIYTSYSNNLRFRDRNGYRKSYTTFTSDSLEDLTNNIYFDWDSQKKKRDDVLWMEEEERRRN